MYYSSMKRLQGYKFELKPKAKHLDPLNQFLGCNRFVWNKLLAINLFRLENKFPLIWYQEMAWFLTLWKQSDEYAFLNDAPSQSLQQTAKALDRAFKDAFDKKQLRKRIPKFKRRGRNEAGIRFPQHSILDQGNSVIKLPKIGWVKYKKSQEIQGVIKNVTISRKGGKYFVSIQTEREVQKPYHPATTAVGIDMGITNFATLSDGTVIAPKNSYHNLKRSLAKEQWKLKNKVKSSSNYRKQIKRINKVHYKIANVRHDFLHKQSSFIVNNHAMIVIEDLKISNMSRSAKGTLEDPGRNVAQKSGLNRSILDQGWGKFRTLLEYKMEWLGGWVIPVNPKHTSQTCPKCHHVSQDNRKTQAEFLCVSCGYKDNADLIAAQNILQRGLEYLSEDSKDKNRGDHGVSLRSEYRKISATGTSSVLVV